MIALSIDTCGSSGSIALGRVDPGSISLLGETDLPGKSYSAQLVPAIRSLLDSHNLTPDSLDAIATVNGPGSFTGIRVGVSTAKGFAHALNLPIVAISRLAVLAWNAHTARAALDAGRNELYYLESGPQEETESLIPAASLTNPEGLALCEPALHWRLPEAILVPPPTAADALRFAAPLLLARNFADLATLDGNYVRRSDAEVFSKAGKR